MGLVGEFYHRNYSLLTRIAQPGGIIKQRSIAEAKVATITLIILLAVIAYGLFRTGRSTTAPNNPGRHLGPSGARVCDLPERR